MNKKETLNTVKPHTEAKISFYVQYLERYLPILMESKFVTKINIYDMFCGAGVYDDGKEGSAVRAFNVINLIYEKYSRNKDITLTLNDSDKERIDKVRDYIKIFDHGFQAQCINTDASDLIKSLINGFNCKQNHKARNLVFIDPYGYKLIKKELILGLMENRRTEVIIFLPISQMFRFRSKTQDEKIESSFLPLKKFIEQFSIDLSKIYTSIDLIEQVRKAFSFKDDYYSTSYHIKNERGTHYALFFMSSNIYGLEKTLEVKWKLDSQQGEGFNNQFQSDLFLETDKLGELQDDLISFLSEERGNKDVYEFIVKKGFLPKHGNKILNELQQSDRLIVKAENYRKGAFYINYNNYKKNESRIRIKIKSSL